MDDCWHEIPRVGSELQESWRSLVLYDSSKRMLIILWRNVQWWIYITHISSKHCLAFLTLFLVGFNHAFIFGCIIHFLAKRERWEDKFGMKTFFVVGYLLCTYYSTLLAWTQSASHILLWSKQITLLFDNIITSSWAISRSAHESFCVALQTCLWSFK